MANPAAFDRDSARRIQAAVRAYEATPRSVFEPTDPSDRRAVLRRAIVTTAITAGTATQAGFGNAKLQQRDPTTGAYGDMLVAGATVIVKVWNGYTGTVAVGKVVYLYRSGVDWELATADCP